MTTNYNLNGDIEIFDNLLVLNKRKLEEENEDKTKNNTDTIITTSITYRCLFMHDHSDNYDGQ